MPVKYDAERIVIRCPNWIGDMVAATASLRCIRKNYPKARLTLLLRPYVQGVVENAPWFDDVIPFDRDLPGAGIMATAKKLRAGRFDLGLLMTHSFSSAIALRLGKVKRRVGHAREGRSWLLTDAVKWPEKRFDPERVSKVALYRGLLEYLGCEGAADQRPEVFTSPEDEARTDEAFKLHGRDVSRKLLVITPGAAFGSSKLWEPARFAQAADQLSREHGMQTAIVTGPGEGAIGMAVARAMKETPMTFREGEVTFGMLKAIISRASLMICNDTGPRHLAIAYNVPVVVVMGPTDPAVTDSEYSKTIILRQNVPCGPCYLRTCPADHLCMKLITPEMVAGAAGELLSPAYGQASGVRKSENA